MWGSIGFIAMVLAAGELFQRYSIGLYHMVGTVVLFSLAAVTFCLHEPKIERRKMVKGELMVVLFNPDVRWFFLSGFFMIFAHASLYVFYSLYLSRQISDRALLGSWRGGRGYFLLLSQQGVE
nr:MFS transporter [Polynucleobacter necessarius]